jgi:hypothetical protein
MVTRVAVCALLVTARLGAQQPETFRGEIIDSICAGATRHAPKLKPRETSASCTVACVKKGAKYVLFNPENGTMYQLDDPLRANISETVLVLLINEQGEKEKGRDEREFS